MVCAADAMSIMARLLVSMAYQKLSFLESLGILLHKRFKSTEERLGGLQAEDDEIDGIQSLERMTWLRWLWFLLGTLPSAIKLLSMTGVGWAKVWEVMFLLSWTINELLILFAMLNQSFFTISRSGRISWPGFEQITRSAQYKHVQRILDQLDRGLIVAAIITHVVIMNSVFRITLRLLDNDDSASRTILAVLDTKKQAAYVGDPYKYASPQYALITSIGMLAGAGGMSFFLRNQTISLMLSCILASAFLLLISTGSNAALFGYVSYSPFYVLAISTFAIAVFMVLTKLAVQRFVMLGRNLLVVYWRDVDGNFGIDYVASLLLVYFLSTVLTALLWYGYIFDPSGTSVPVWTGVFG